MIVWSVGRRKLIEELEALYRSRYRQFLRVAIAIVGDEEAAHDAVQDGFARALRSARSYRGEGTVEAWLWSVIVNAARAGRPSADVDLVPPDELHLASQNGRGGEVDSQIRAWIAALPERQRLAVFLRYYADLDYNAIATALGIEVGTVSATLSTAHAALRKSFKEVSR
jgi:RNA polymerase sigma-70 factor (ECF subfamily)